MMNYLYHIKIFYSMLTLHFPGNRKMSRWSAIKMVFRTCTRNWTHAWCWLHYNIDILLPKINWKYAAGRGLSQWKMELTNKSQDFIITCWMYIIIEDIMSEYFKGIYSKDMSTFDKCKIPQNYHSLYIPWWNIFT